MNGIINLIFKLYKYSINNNLTKMNDQYKIELFVYCHIMMKFYIVIKQNSKYFIL